VATRQERATSFGAIADDYDRLRPGPADEAIRWLLPAGCRAVLDVGAGTGKLSRALAAHVPQVTAVEPDPRMRAVLAGRSPGVRVLAGTGEAIPLPDASVDGVFVSSAWHWMDPALAIPEIARVLRDGGRFGVLGTSVDRDAGWVPELRRAPAPGDGQPDRDRRGHLEVVLPEDAPFGHTQTREFTFTRPMTTADLVDLVATYSRLITASPEVRAAALDHARAVLAERFPGGGEVDVPMRTRCWRADRVG
jgi:SAM-dependent methyltransferase